PSPTKPTSLERQRLAKRWCSAPGCANDALERRVPVIRIGADVSGHRLMRGGLVVVVQRDTGCLLDVVAGVLAMAWTAEDASLRWWAEELSPDHKDVRRVRVVVDESPVDEDAKQGCLSHTLG